MNLLDILSPACIKSPLAGAGKREIIAELVDLLAGAGRVTDAGAVKDAVWTREQVRSTGIGLGLAIPHGRCAGVPGLALAIGKPAQPMEFQAIDGKPVQLIVLLVSPPDRNTDHIQALARISRMALSESLRNQLYAAASPDEIYQLMKDHESRAS
ncbi:MAG: PTS sugar transporter subunit IIA [Phycisphaerales bacterium]